MSNDKRMNKLCFAFAALHLVIIFASLPLAKFNEGWNFVFVWAFWFLIDFPVSTLFFVLFYPLHYLNEAIPSLKWLLYPPYFVHGVLGTIWWFYLPRIYYKVKAKKKST
ncbi:MAG TPA: hypothetical protein VL995_09325 [Cellvibrio sp.]|nr:hypothetical protein [Cellvibrio sp.]